MLLSMPDEFISKSILLKVVVMENNNSKYKDYRANLVENNDKNNLYYIIESAGINKLRILSSCVYTDVNKFKQNPYFKLISTIYNYFYDNTMEDHYNNLRPIISYNLHNDRKFLNDWDDSNFFSIAFPALFFYKNGGYIIF